jgi:hypothetical protein
VKGNHPASGGAVSAFSGEREALSGPDSRLSNVVIAGDPATWTVAIATVGLFFVTGMLFWATYGMVKTATSEIGIEEKRLAAEQRPHAYPASLDPWVRQQPPYASGRAREVIPLSNAGPGIAHNVTGYLRFTDGVFVPIVPLTIQPGQTLDASFDWGGSPRQDQWKDARGFLVYDDVAGETWLTEYYVRQSNQGLFFDFEASGRLREFGNLHDRYDIRPEFIRGEANRPLDRALAQASS